MEVDNLQGILWRGYGLDKRPHRLFPVSIFDKVAWQVVVCEEEDPIVHGLYCDSDTAKTLYVEPALAGDPLNF